MKAYDTFETPLGDFTVLIDESGAVAAAAFGGVDGVPGAGPLDDLVEDRARTAEARRQIEEYFANQMIPSPSFERERLLDVARWLIDSVDPHSVGHLYALEGREVLLQMDVGDIVIPNRTTRTLQRVSGLPMREYGSPLHADLVVPLVGDGQLRDMADYLAGDIDM